ncbi:MAG: biosynthetic peptidoglycan transglycosylase [bacterium]|nr:biosynthetic peptidoglycan transglycosylase [bacterium]
MFKPVNIFVAGLARGFYAIAQLWDVVLREDFELIKSSMLSDEIRNHDLLRTVLIVEDKRFFDHKGIDVRAVIRALYNTVFWNHLEGGSTIEQQYVRLVTKRIEISLKRKMREGVLAAKLSDTFSKLQILNSYLLKYQFTGHVYGMIELAQDSGFDIERLNNDQVSILVARLKYPFAQENNSLYLKRVVLIRQLIEQQEFSPKKIFATV